MREEGDGCPKWGGYRIYRNKRKQFYERRSVVSDNNGTMQDMNENNSKRKALRDN